MKIKTFEEALKALGENNSFVKEYEAIKDIELSPDLLAYLKLRIITAALNEGWEPKFTKKEYRYYPWFYLYTKEEIDRMSERERKEVVLFGGNAFNGASAGLAFADSNDDWAAAYAPCGSRLAYKTSELAVYSGRQFKEIWANFCFKSGKYERKGEGK